MVEVAMKAVAVVVPPMKAEEEMWRPEAERMPPARVLVPKPRMSMVEVAMSAVTVVVPVMTALPETERGVPGVEVPKPTLPFARTVKIDDEAKLTTSNKRLSVLPPIFPPQTVSCEYGVVVPIATLVVEAEPKPSYSP